MRAVDTNVLVRLVIRDDASQVRQAEELVTHGAWVSTVVLAETAWALISVYGFRPDDMIVALAILLQQPNLTFQEVEAVQAAMTLFSSNPGVEFTDCLILELARKNGHLPLGTFDRKLARLPGAHRIGDSSSPPPRR